MSEVRSVIRDRSVLAVELLTVRENLGGLGGGCELVAVSAL